MMDHEAGSMVDQGRPGRPGDDEAAGKDRRGLWLDVIDPKNIEGVQTGVKAGKEDNSRK